MINNHAAVIYSQRMIDAVKLNLAGAVVLTESATGSYSVTAGIAALAGAKKVYAIARNTPFGTAEDAADATKLFAVAAGCSDSIEIVNELSSVNLSTVDIVTNSGVVRPINMEMIKALPRGCVVTLMYEPWELRDKDVDIDCCRKEGIPVAGSNEGHEVIGILPDVGFCAVKSLWDNGVPLHGSRVAIVSDSKFAFYTAQAFAPMHCERVDVFCPKELSYAIDCIGCGVKWQGDLNEFSSKVHRNPLSYDIIVPIIVNSNIIFYDKVASSLIPTGKNHLQGVTLCLVWGTVNECELRISGINIIPDKIPARGHMGILPSVLGYGTVVRLQIGGLKVGEVLWKAMNQFNDVSATELAVIESGYALAINDKNPNTLYRKK